MQENLKYMDELIWSERCGNAVELAMGVQMKRGIALCGYSWDAVRTKKLERARG